MKVVILCGGQGTRIRDVADNIPKPMIPIGGLPILWHIMKHYAGFDHKGFVLALGHQGQAIKDFFRDYDSHTRDFTIRLGGAGAPRFHGANNEKDWSVTLAETGAVAMTGARLWRVRKYLDAGKDFALTYGDGVGDVDLAELLRFHRSHKRAMTVTGVRPPGRFGEIIYDKRGRISEFNEKPQASGGLISGGFFICKPKVFEYLSGDAAISLEESPMRKLARDGELMVYEHRGFWQPMDTARDYQLLNRLCAEGKAPWMTWL